MSNEITPAAANLIYDIVRKEGRSLLQYVNESYPWTKGPESQAFFEKIQAQAIEERDGVARLVKLLLKKHVKPPYLGSYPSSYTTINYTKLSFLVPYLIDFERTRIAELEKNLAGVTDPDFRAEVEKILAMKKRHLADMSAGSVAA